MKTLILKHNGHEAHVPYGLPDSLRFDCFVPEHGMCIAYVDLRAEEILVLEVHRPMESPIGTPGAEMLSADLCNHSAVLEQAGDVCTVFGWLDRYEDARERGFIPGSNPDACTLSTIAEMALLESDLHTADLRLPDAVRGKHSPIPDPRDPDESYAHHRLQRFIEHVLVPRAQELATKAAKRRQSLWLEEQIEAMAEAAAARRDDAAVKYGKERE
jgi:hypothetical protein